MKQSEVTRMLEALKTIQHAQDGNQPASVELALLHQSREMLLVALMEHVLDTLQLHEQWICDT
jgi:hypothetical protein